MIKCSKKRVGVTPKGLTLDDLPPVKYKSSLAEIDLTDGDLTNGNADASLTLIIDAMTLGDLLKLNTSTGDNLSSIAPIPEEVGVLTVHKPEDVTDTSAEILWTSSINPGVVYTAGYESSTYSDWEQVGDAAPFYTSLADLGLVDGDLTLDDPVASFPIIIAEMEAGSVLKTHVETGTNLASITAIPGQRGILEIFKSEDLVEEDCSIFWQSSEVSGNRAHSAYNLIDGFVEWRSLVYGIISEKRYTSITSNINNIAPGDVVVIDWIVDHVLVDRGSNIEYLGSIDREFRINHSNIEPDGFPTVTVTATRRVSFSNPSLVGTSISRYNLATRTSAGGYTTSDGQIWAGNHINMGGDPDYIQSDGYTTTFPRKLGATTTKNHFQVSVGNESTSDEDLNHGILYMWVTEKGHYFPN